MHLGKCWRHRLADHVANIGVTPPLPCFAPGEVLEERLQVQIMATICRRGDKWQVQVRRKGCPPLSRSFNQKADAQAWARHVELLADRGELSSGTTSLTGSRRAMKRQRSGLRSDEVDRTALAPIATVNATQHTSRLDAIARQQGCGISCSSLLEVPVFDDDQAALVASTWLPWPARLACCPCSFSSGRSRPGPRLTAKHACCA